HGDAGIHVTTERALSGPLNAPCSSARIEERFPSYRVILTSWTTGILTTRATRRVSDVLSRPQRLPSVGMVLAAYPFGNEGRHLTPDTKETDAWTSHFSPTSRSSAGARAAISSSPPSPPPIEAIARPSTVTS